MQKSRLSHIIRSGISTKEKTMPQGNEENKNDRLHAQCYGNLYPNGYPPKPNNYSYFGARNHGLNSYYEIRRANEKIFNKAESVGENRDPGDEHDSNETRFRSKL